MTKQLAWEIMNKVVWPRVDVIGIRNSTTIYSSLDWDNGIALKTDEGIIHVLGTGEVVDVDNVLNYIEGDY